MIPSILHRITFLFACLAAIIFGWSTKTDGTVLWKIQNSVRGHAARQCGGLGRGYTALLSMQFGTDWGMSGRFTIAEGACGINAFFVFVDVDIPF